MFILKTIAGRQIKIGSNTTKKRPNQIYGLIGSYADCFSDEIDHENDLDNEDYSDDENDRVYTTYSIDINDDFDCNLIYELTPEVSDSLEEVVDKYLNCGILQYSDSPYSSPARLIRRNGVDDIEIDYSELNEITEDAGHEVPRLSAILKPIRGSRFFSKIVLKDPYHQMFLDEDSRYLTAFLTDFGRFEFLTLHTGLGNAPNLLQEMMDDIFDEMNVIVHLGAILVYDQTEQDHFYTLKSVFKALRENDLKIDNTECAFMMNNIVFKDYIIRQNGAYINRSQLGQICNSCVPRNKDELTKFMTLCNQYCSLILNYDQIATPLYKLSSPGIKFSWNENYRKAFNSLHKAFIKIRNESQRY